MARHFLLWQLIKFEILCYMSNKIESKASATKNTTWIANFSLKKIKFHFIFNEIIIIKLNLIQLFHFLYLIIIMFIVDNKFLGRQIIKTIT